MTNGKVSNFHILESSRVVESSRDKRRMVRLEVTVSDWFYNALLGKEVLTINRAYFRLRKPLARRLYELARKHCGRQAAWHVDLENLKEKCGALVPLKYFRYQMREIIEADDLPDYGVALDDKDKVTFTNRVYAARNLAVAQAQGTLSGLDDMPPLKEQTIRRGAAIVEAAGTGWDYHAIQEEFTRQLMDGFRPRNINAAFIGFVKKKVARRP
jgi:hypothetical protein